MTGILHRLWNRLAAPDAPLRRLARKAGAGRLLVRLGLADRLPGLPPQGSAAGAASGALPPAERGVLLVGHPYGVQAVGEFLRCSAGAFASAGVPFHIRNTPDWGEHLKDTHTEFGFWDRITTESAYRANVFHLNANEMDAARRHLGGAFFAGRYNIACWHWELSRFPDAWSSALRGVDELWASSRFIQHCLAEKARVPVVWMPHPMDLRGGAGITRRDLGLPESTYLFLTSFDFNSFVTRKNPLAVVRAFRGAFPPSAADPVGLVVKVSGGAERPADATAFLASPELEDPRIVVINELFDRRRMVGLIGQCDCFVSLHRSEGFGRGLAEAMLLGKPVIATAYSGNMDFTNPLNSCLVDYRLVPVGREEYPHAAGQRWADPDVEQAASYMRRLARDPDWGAGLGRKGRELIEAQHGIRAVGERYRARLHKLGFA